MGALGGFATAASNVRAEGGEEGRPPESPRQEPVTSGPDWELSSVASFLTPPIRGATNPFGAGFGGRLGLVFSDVYLGVTIVDYLGGTDVDLADSALLLGAEGGYTLRLARFGGGYLGLRPQVGLGDAVVSHTDPSLGRVDTVTSASGRASQSTTSVTLTVHTFYVQPALKAVLVSGRLLVALGGSSMIVPSISYGGASNAATWVCYGLQGELGLHF